MFSDEAINILLSPLEEKGNISTKYGYGWNVRERSNTKVVFHDGSGFGFRTFMGKIPSRDFTVFILSNCYNSIWEEIYKHASHMILELSERFE